MTERTWAFVVRIWQEDGVSSECGSSNGALIRGSLQQAATGELHYFNGLEHLVQLLAMQIHNEPARPSGDDEDQG
ncbi:hypothetical protein GC175_31875 [bacterium]|nr:hypothetical protein [bacterium]